MGKMTAWEQYTRNRNQCIVLYFTYGFTPKEIAGYMGMPARTVSHVLNQCGITKLRTKMVYERDGG